ncbi:CLUMA_CG014677, isoform A [Clunio marinus]|uniref:CLUMA_CG014677, isoform A n=1 Tax=Clunio marinus TaxID=568069 RepID=A0A1J1IS73_9DIPT|nr:CLUMA_CG014677, isoform A [Clunio marinus]
MLNHNPLDFDLDCKAFAVFASVLSVRIVVVVGNKKEINLISTWFCNHLISSRRDQCKCEVVILSNKMMSSRDRMMLLNKIENTTRLMLMTIFSMR